MSLIDFLEDLVLENWKFWLEDGRLKYRAPKHAVNNSVLEQLKQYKTEIIKILEDDGLDIFPLSYGQQALWFLWKMSPESSAYNLSLPILFTSPVETNTLLKACKLLTEEHCLLRAVFSVKNGKPFARLTEYIDWTVVDATSWDEKRLLHEMETSHHTLFNLETGPVVRFKLFQRLDKDQILLVAMHHIVSDGWSMEIIRKQLPTLYEKAKKDLLTKPYHHTSYQTYVYWQQELLTSSAGEKLWQFWKEKLAALPVLNLPTDFQRPKVKTYNGKNIFFQLSQELSEKVKGLAKKYSVTPYIFFKTLFLILLHCYTNQDDIVIGSFNSGRSRAEFAAVVGYFVDSIPIRSKLLDRQTFKDFLQQTKETFLEALEHADLPFALIVERLQIERDSSRSPIFDVSFNYLTRTNLSQEKVNEIIETFDIPQSDSKFDLSLTLTDFGKSITGAFSYNSDLFCEETVACICNYFENIVEGVVKDQDQKVSAIALDAEGDRLFRPILVGNNLILESKDLVHRLFEAEAAKRPEDIAVKAENGLLSYRELNRRANGLALYLQQFGVKREALVAVFTKRSTNFIIAILAIHKAAAAYVPLDPSYPKETLSYMLSHAGVAIVLTEESLLHLLDGLNVSTLSIDSFCSDYSHYLCDKNPETEVGLKDLSYVIYTSGSTGKPKGVAIEHGSLSGYVKSIIEEIEIDPKSNFALASTFSADLGNTVIFPSLCSGGCLHILSEEARFHSSNFTNYIESEQIDYLKIVPSHFEALISSTKAVLPKKALIFGGESANRQWVEELQLKHPSCQIVNHYGPTETTVGILTYKVSTKSFPTQTLPLKQPVANTDIYLLDKSMQTVFKGMIGEIYVAGDCLSRGYINSSDTTREAFINYQNTTLYKTGDLARLLPSGEIEIVGRQDRQVKIRGYRVELEHIEAILQGNPSVKQAVV
ncbi:MAG: amino acid adenylation domain-containing protein, partial [Blastocatellia bacterium]|nr:amino acid adenylation domain-containing protein [Blastocatellia bacterium]